FLPSGSGVFLKSRFFWYSRSTVFLVDLTLTTTYCGYFHCKLERVGIGGGSVTSLLDLCSSRKYEATVIGAGPNGLSAGIVLASAGLSVLVVEANNIIGGGCRSAALTLPGYIHDICSSIHPLGIGSPYFRTLPLGDYGLKWSSPLAPLAHPFDNGRA